jgi:outer membrane receptor for ferrienterochelin and colicins
MLVGSLSSLAQKNVIPDSLSKPKDQHLEEVVVTGTYAPRSLKNTPVLTKIISGTAIRESGATTLVEALENFIPGVSFDPNQAMGDNIQIQGLDNKYVLILVDGERLVGERTEKVNLSRLNTSDIKQVEIINGASAALYGSNAIGSVINIITQDVKKTVQGEARVRVSNYLNVYDASVGFKVKGFSSKTSFTAKDMRPYQVKGESYMADPYEDYSVSQSFKYSHKKFNIELKGNFYNKENWLLEKYQTRIDRNYTIGGKFNYIFSPKNSLTLSGNSDNYDGYQVYKRKEDSTVYSNASKYHSLKLIDVWDVTQNIHIVSGVELNFEHVFSHNQFTARGWRQASNQNLFLQGEIKFNSEWEALLGARYIYHSQFGSYLAPNFSLMYRHKSLCLRANVSNGYKTPTLKELFMEFPHRIGENLPFWVIGNPDLAPEKSWYKALSAEYIIKNLNVSLTLYDNSIKNKINTVTVFNQTENRTEMKYENVEEALITGVDISGEWSFSKYFHLRGGYAFTNAVDRNTRQQLSGNSKHTATMSFQFLQKHLPWRKSATKWGYNLLLSARIMSPRTVYSENNGQITELKTGNYYIVNFVYTQHFPIYKDLKGDWQFGINNLLNHINKDFAAYNPGITFFGSISIRF